MIKGSNKVLVVEDEAITALNLKSILEHGGYEVIGLAKSSTEAIDIAVKSRPDLVLMDVRIQGSVDGIETASQIKYLLKSITIVFLSSYKPSDTFKNRRRGSEPYLEKPVVPEILLATMDRALAKRDGQERAESGTGLPS